jgi:hypothetical protein
MQTLVHVEILKFLHFISLAGYERCARQSVMHSLDSTGPKLWEWQLGGTLVQLKECAFHILKMRQAQVAASYILIVKQIQHEEENHRTTVMTTSANAIIITVILNCMCCMHVKIRS